VEDTGVEVDVEASVLARHGLTRGQIGWLGEQDLDRIHLLGSHGRLQSYLPVVDSRRVDRVYSWDGIGQPWFVQVKGIGAAGSDGRYTWTIPAAHFKPYERLLVILGIIVVAEGRLRDPVWCIPAADLVRLASHGYHGATGARLAITASPTGDDKFSRYRTTLANLWEQLAPAPELQAAAPLPELPVLRQEEGAFYELSQIVEVLRGSQDDLLAFRPANDIAGRDLLIQLVDSFRALYMQIKGTARRHRANSIQHMVHRHTFVPAEDFWLAFYYLEPRPNRLFPDCWLVPSVEFARRTADQRNAAMLTFDTTLIEDHDRWREFRHPIGDQAAVIRAGLKALPGSRPRRA
jgi:hypothetical protein